jgi:hypothetical protein
MALKTLLLYLVFMSSNSSLVESLETLWPSNKAKGLLAQGLFFEELAKGSFGTGASEKIFPGCWLLSPKEKDFYKFRYCFFINPKLVKTETEKLEPKEVLGDKFRPFFAVAEFMNNASIGVGYVVVSTNDGQIPLDEIRARRFQKLKWKLLKFQNGEFMQEEPTAFFQKWAGDRGRATYGKTWDTGIKQRMQNLSRQSLDALLLNELFMTGFVKEILKKPLNDPYDVDSFLMSISQKHVLPMEIKEKFAREAKDGKFFGIDAGRIMMLLRLCLPNEANAVYLIRELNEKGSFLGWKYITLADIVMTSSWNLQAGGKGMGGQSTQTVRLPYDYFKKFDSNEMSEERLKEIGSLPKDAKSIAKQFGNELFSRFGKPSMKSGLM